MGKVNTAFKSIPKNGRIDAEDLRCFGFRDLWTKAVNDLHKNSCDIHEDYYEYAVLERMSPGIHPDVLQRQFFKFDKEKQGFFEIPEPEELKHLCNFSMG